MDSKPFFSIIVPAHNAADHINKCLDSIKMQTFQDYELIVVVDNSNDDTDQIAHLYADKVILTGFGQDGQARNAGIDAAEGEWLLFLDDDDWWIHEYVLHELHEVCSHTDADMIPFSFIWPNDQYGRFYWDHRKYGINYAPWSKAYRRSFVGGTRFSAEKFTSDVPFAKGLMAKNPKIFILDRLMYYYNYLRPGSQTWEDKNKC